MNKKDYKIILIPIALLTASFLLAKASVGSDIRIWLGSMSVFTGTIGLSSIGFIFIDMID